MKKVNRHGVHISDVSSVHESFGKNSFIPSDDITLERVKAWKLARKEALKTLPSFMAQQIPMDCTYASLWLAEKLMSLHKEDGTRAVKDEKIDELSFAIGQLGRGRSKECWKVAVKWWNRAQRTMEKKKKKRTQKDTSASETLPTKRVRTSTE